MRIELKVVLSVIGKTVCKRSAVEKRSVGRQRSVVAEGTGAPERKKRAPIVLASRTDRGPAAVVRKQRIGTGQSAVVPPLEAKIARTLRRAANAAGDAGADSRLFT